MSALGRAGSNPVVSTTDLITSLKLDYSVPCFVRLELSSSREHNVTKSNSEGFAIGPLIGKAGFKNLVMSIRKERTVLVLFFCSFFC